MKWACVPVGVEKWIAVDDSGRLPANGVDAAFTCKLGICIPDRSFSLLPNAP